MEQFVIVKQNVLDDATCDDIVRFMQTNRKSQSSQYRKKGSHSLASVIYLEKKLTPESNIHEKVYTALNSVIKNEVGPFLNSLLGLNQFKKGNISVKPYQYRHVKGPTRLHSDGSVLIRIGNELFNRVGTLILTLNDNFDTLVFPAQQKTIQLEKRSFVFFPSEWIYPHFSIFTPKERFSIQTWMYRKVNINDSSLLQLANMKIERTPSFRIVDDILDLNTHQECCKRFDICKWTYATHKSYGNIWMKDLSNSVYFTNIILNKLAKSLNVNVSLKTCYGIGQSFGTGSEQFSSDNCDSKIIYLYLGPLFHTNKDSNKNMGYLGATELQYRLDKFITSIAYKPNRCVIFSDCIPHREMSPNRVFGFLKNIIVFELF